MNLRTTCRTRGRSSGFTLLEVLVATIILALSVASIYSISARCLSQVKVDRQRHTAWEVLEQWMHSISVMGIDAYVESGEFAREVVREDQVYVCEVVPYEVSIGTLYRVEAVVSWQDDRGRARRITMATEMNGQPPAPIMPGSSEGS